MTWSPPARLLGWGCLIYALINLALWVAVEIRAAYKPWP